MFNLTGSIMITLVFLCVYWSIFIYLGDYTKCMDLKHKNVREHDFWKKYVQKFFLLFSGTTHKNTPIYCIWADFSTLVGWYKPWGLVENRPPFLRFHDLFTFFKSVAYVWMFEMSLNCVFNEANHEMLPILWLSFSKFPI